MEKTCGDDFGCHTDHAVDSGPGDLVLMVPSSYLPNEMYTIDVGLSQEGQLRWGFELTVLDAGGSSVGSLAPLDANTQTSSSLLGRDYIKHTSVGTAFPQPDANSWSFVWTAPAEDVGPITFYAAGNAADGNGASTNPAGVGDFIYTNSAMVPLPEPSPTLGEATVVALLGALVRRGALRSGVVPWLTPWGASRSG